MEIPFSKYSGCGNDFILIDNRNGVFPVGDAAPIQALCHRHEGVGADGVILLENSDVADYKMRIFNADGGEAEMCGNGIRCLYRFLEELENVQSSCTVESMNFIHALSGEGDRICATMAPPTEMEWGLELLGQPLHFLNTGVPHVVIFVDELKGDFRKVAPKLRHHPYFARGANVNLVSFEKNGLSVRTFERGVEAETLACGTGATAAALVAAKKRGMPSPIAVKVASGEVLEICFDKEFTQVTQVGPARAVFYGRFSVAEISRFAVKSGQSQKEPLDGQKN